MTVLAFKGAAEDAPHYLEDLTALERIKEAHKRFGKDLVLTTSFGIQSSVLLHMALQVNPDIRVIFVDTGYLFNDTYEYAKKLTERLDFKPKVFSAHRSPSMQEAFEGQRWESEDKAVRDAFDLETKVEPLNRGLKELKAKAWLSGLRRGQNDRRANLDVQEQQGALLKIYPLIDWSNRDIFKYMKEHNLPQHPLFDLGYSSVGNWFDSQPGTQRGECGIHVPGQVERPADYVI